MTSVRRLAYFEGAHRSSADRRRRRARRVGRPEERLSSSAATAAWMKVDLEKLLVLRDFSADRSVEYRRFDRRPAKAPRRRRRRRGDAPRPRSVQSVFQRPGIHRHRRRAGQERAAGEHAIALVSADGTRAKLTDGIKIEPGDSILVPERSFSRSEVVQFGLGRRRADDQLGQR